MNVLEQSARRPVDTSSGAAVVALTLASVATDDSYIHPQRLSLMPTCSVCETTVEVESLVRHDYPRVTVVHCPSCGAVLGQYRRHGDAPRTDTRQST